MTSSPGRKEKIDYVNAFRASGHCVICGEEDPYVLEFHHVIPSERTNTIRRIANSHASWERLYTEMAKCVLLCANCHAKWHNDSHPDGVIDGIIKEYHDGHEQ